MATTTDFQSLLTACAGVALALAAVPAGATAFAPQQCTPCGSGWQTVDWRYDVGGLGTGAGERWELPVDPISWQGSSANGWPRYTNTLDNTRWIIGNENVRKFSFRFDAFDVEGFGYDWFKFGPYDAGGNYTRLDNASQALGWREIDVGSSLQSRPGVMIFHTDDSVTRDGFAIGQARVCCNPGPAAGERPLASGYRNAGVLLNTSDVVYLTSDVVCDGASYEDSIALWPMVANGADFDLYAKCNQRPTPTNFDFSSTSGSAQEFINLPANACPCGGRWYIAVQSYRGSGGFNVIRSNRYAGHHLKPILACTDFPASPGEMSMFRDLASDGAKVFYGMTEGTQYIDRIDLYNSGSCNNCQLCFTHAPRSYAQSYVFNSEVYIGTDTWGLDANNNRTTYWPSVLAHEWGHQWLGFPDEYYDPPGGGGSQVQCGHSLMGDSNGAWTAPGYLNSTQFNLCYSRDHKHDPNPAAPPTNVNALWPNLVQTHQAPPRVTPQETPDNYSYLGFDFRGAMGNVVVH